MEDLEQFFLSPLCLDMRSFAKELSPQHLVLRSLFSHWECATPIGIDGICVFKSPACIFSLQSFLCKQEQHCNLRELWCLESYLLTLPWFQRTTISPIQLNFPLQLEFKYSNKFVLETLKAPLCLLQGNTLWVFFSGRWRFLCAWGDWLNFTWAKLYLHILVIAKGHTEKQSIDCRCTGISQMYNFKLIWKKSLAMH